MIHRSESGTYSISSGHAWLPGIYADERAARYAFRLSNVALQQLSSSRGVGDDYQPITFDDLKEARKAAA